MLSEAADEARSCDVFIVVGSSLVVQPAASLPVLAKNSGAKVCIINKDPTPLDAIAEIVVHSGASEVLSGIF